MKLLFALVVLAPLAAHADPCANAHYMHAVDPALRPAYCAALASEVYKPDPSDRTGRSDKRVEVAHLGRGTMADDENRAYHDVAGIVAQGDTAAGLVRMPMPDKIRVLLDPNPLVEEHRATQFNERDAAITDHALAREDCVLAYHYKDGEAAKFQLAHELFHCIVVKTFEEAHLSTTDSDWWAEGSAEFFASIAYPGVGTAGDALAFHANEAAPLFSRSRDAVVFFDWFANQPGKLKGLIDTVQDKPPGPSVDLDELIGGNVWLEFEEAYFDHSIHGPNGLVVYPATPAPPTRRVNSSTTVTYTATPYIIRGAILEFAEGKAYDLDGGAADDFHWKWSEAQGGGWENPPATVHTCHQLRRYRLVFAAKNREVTKRLRITARDEREADCPCVVGAWQQTSASIGRVATRLQEHGVRNASCSVVGGGTVLRFTPDHAGDETYQGLHTLCQSRAITAEGTSNGTRSFAWAETSATQLTFTGAGGNANTHIVVHASGHDSASDVPVTVSGTGAVTYRCTRTDLHLEIPSGRGGTEQYDYTRVAAPSP